MYTATHFASTREPYSRTFDRLTKAQQWAHANSQGMGANVRNDKTGRVWGYIMDHHGRVTITRCRLAS